VGSRAADARGPAAAACRVEKCSQAANQAELRQGGQLLDSFFSAAGGQSFSAAQIPENTL
jgi:hypothetical protein